MSSLVGTSQTTVTAKPSSVFDCTTCHDPIAGGSEYVQHKFVFAGPKGGRYSRSYRYHPDCHDPPPRPRATSAGKQAATPTDPTIAIVAIVLVALIVGGITVYAWWKRKEPAPA